MVHSRMKVIMVGAFPPPVHGMSLVNAAVREALKHVGMEPRIINLAAPSLDRSLMTRLGRLPRVLVGLAVLVSVRGARGGTLYMSVSGGLGKVYELLFVMLARLRGMRLFLHHHSFSYLDMPSQLMGWLIRVSGSDATQVTLSQRMAERLKSLYPVGRTVAVSNVVFLLGRGWPPAEPRRRVRVLGFISNIAAEKGVFEFLDLLDSIGSMGLPLIAKLAGPFLDAKTEQKVRTRLLTLPNIEYVGSKYGVAKETFFREVDALIFPTRYVNEAEPVILHEAMSQGIPVIAYGRGAIPEIVGSDGGKVIEPSDPFLPAALEQIRAWLNNPLLFYKASVAAAQRYTETYAKNEQRWRALLNCLTDDITDPCGRSRKMESGE